MVMLALLAYSGLVAVLNRTLFRRVANPTKVFWTSLVIYLVVTIVCVYFFIRTSLVIHDPS